MKIDTSLLTKDEQVYLELQRLYEGAGYRKFKMRKFEEYSLYLENKSFLASENIIAFNDPNGKLLALKPDVTLSIVKNAKATAKNGEKVYYRESVYRLDKQSREYKEINQVGLEYIGKPDSVQTLDICLLAVKSLAAIDQQFIFAVSHMGYIGGLLECIGLHNAAAEEGILSCLRAKNQHGLQLVAQQYGIDDNRLAPIRTLIGCGGDFRTALDAANAVAQNEAMRSAVDELEQVYGMFASSGFADRVRLDFSILNDIDYYNGIIFQGFVEGMPRMILSGGRYDRLLEKYKDGMGAMGFALALQELNARYPQPAANKVDVILLYDNESAKSVLEQAEMLRLSGKSVIVSRQIPDGVKFSEIVRAQK